MVRPVPEPAVERFADTVQAAVRVGREESGGGVAAVRLEDHFGRTQQLGTTDDGPSVPDAVRELLMVSAPGKVGGPDLAVAVAEACRAGGQQQGGVVAGPAVPAGPHPGALLDGAALRVAFTAPASGQVKEFDGVGSHRQHGGQFVELKRRRAGVGDGVAHFQQPAVVQFQRGFNGDAGIGIRLDNHS
ncbi:hypothetical protein D9M72_542750 [compost metagenome]